MDIYPFCPKDVAKYPYFETRFGENWVMWEILDRARVTFFFFLSLISHNSIFRKLNLKYEHFAR